MEFRYVHLADNVNSSIKMAERSAEQGKFWETYRALFTSNDNDNPDLGLSGRAVGFDLTTCGRCMKRFDDSELVENFMRIRDIKISNTPTILINDRIYFGELTLEALAHEIGEIATK